MNSDPKSVGLHLINPNLNHAVLSPQKTLFESSDDWTIQFGLDVPEDAQMKGEPFPAHIKRPDGLMYSEKMKKLAYIELTAPWKESLRNTLKTAFTPPTAGRSSPCM